MPYTLIGEPYSFTQALAHRNPQGRLTAIVAIHLNDLLDHERLAWRYRLVGRLLAKDARELGEWDHVEYHVKGHDEDVLHIQVSMNYHVRAPDPKQGKRNG